MKLRLEDLEVFLPRYLGEDDKEKLFAELDAFPDNIDERMYTSLRKDEPTIFQGDGISGLWVVQLPWPQAGPSTGTLKRASGMILSNSCDVDPANRRRVPPHVLYCPIISLPKFEGVCKESGVNSSDFLVEVRRQRWTTGFYLPDGPGTPGGAVALLDRVNNCSLRELDPTRLPGERLFTLSDYGFWLFLYKLSIHFTRIREGISRSAASE